MRAGGPSESTARPGPGLLPLFSLITSLGLLLVALADDGARSGESYADPLFWAGLAVIVVPIGARQFASSTGRRERLGLVITLALAMYLVKVLHSPLQFTLHDELGHLRTTYDILLSGHLYAHNPLVGTYGTYPGLEVVTAFATQLTGLSVFTAGLVVVGAGRLVLSISLFLVAEQVSGSKRVAGLAACIYAANPNFVFFGSLFAYESLAVPLGMLAIALGLRAGVGRPGRLGLAVAALIMAVAVVPTHHVTSWALVIVFGLLAVFASVGQRWRLGVGSVPGAWKRYLRIAVVLLAAVIAWSAFVGGADTNRSLGPVARNTINSVGDLISGASNAKKPFQTSNGTKAETPLEQVVGLGSILLILAGSALGLVMLRRRGRLSPMEAIFVLCVLAYPFSLAIRLTSAGTETSNRASEFLFLGLAYVLATGVTGTRRQARAGRSRRGAGVVRASVAGAAIAILVGGGIIVGWPPYARLPGRYEPAAGPRSVDPYSVSAARWAGANIPRGTLIVTDSVNGTLAISRGLNPQRGEVNGEPVSRVFFSRTLGPLDRGIIRFDHIAYLIVDRRLSQSAPLDGRYFEGGDPTGFKAERGIPLPALTKFDGARGVGKVYDNGPIAVYDVRAISDRRAR